LRNHQLVVKRRDILRTDRRIHLRVGADEAITIDDHIQTIQGVTVTKRYIHFMQKVASSPQLYTNKRGGTDATIEAFA
jgi:hypothetical protein